MHYCDDMQSQVNSRTSTSELVGIQPNVRLFEVRVCSKSLKLSPVKIYQVSFQMIQKFLKPFLRVWKHSCLTKFDNT